MNLYFLVADLELPSDAEPDVKGVCITTDSISDFEELMGKLDNVGYHDDCQDKFHLRAFESIDYEVVHYNGVAIGQFNYIGAMNTGWTDRVITALTEHHSDWNVVSVQPEALASIIANSGGLTLDDLSGPWKGVIVRNQF